MPASMPAHMPCWPACFALCLLLALAFQSLFLQWPLTVLTRQTRQTVLAIKQSMFLNMMSMGFYQKMNRISKLFFYVSTTEMNKLE